MEESNVTDLDEADETDLAEAEAEADEFDVFLFLIFGSCLTKGGSLFIYTGLAVCTNMNNLFNIDCHHADTPTTYVQDKCF